MMDEKINELSTRARKLGWFFGRATDHVAAYKLIISGVMPEIIIQEGCRDFDVAITAVEEVIKAGENFLQYACAVFRIDLKQQPLTIFPSFTSPSTVSQTFNADSP